MGKSHFKSNVIGYAGTEYIATMAKVQTGRLITTNATITTLTGVTTSNVVTASQNVARVSGLGDSSYIQLGLQQYLFVGNSNTEATVIAEATALVATPIKGSMYMSRKGNMWFYVSDTQASPVQALA